MPSTAPPTRRPRRRAAVLGAILVAAVALGGCEVTNLPTSYDAQHGVVRENFLQSCTGKVPNASTTSIIATDAQCECAFRVFQEKVPFNDADRPRVSGYPADAPTFEQLDLDVVENVSAYDRLPRSVRDELDRCRQQGLVAPGATTAPPATATPGTTAAT